MAGGCGVKSRGALPLFERMAYQSVGSPPTSDVFRISRVSR